ncbi:MAG: UDP-N-acetylmuramate--L-alanine ligase [Gammaproteobacteria bacterium]|nr:UDP-N-acetylmuramate--L-alanine ligase [Gammaproteobacteria bacterium]
MPMGANQFKSALLERQFQRFHFIGIGGVGMRALAKMILQLGFEVSGSDVSPCDEVTGWANRGLITLYDNHKAKHAQGASCVIYSSAIKALNPEYQFARNQNIPVFHRSEMIAWMGEYFKVIAVSGTHGKTSTTAMVAHILRQAGLAPSYCIGAGLNGEILAEVGAGEWLVLEADESDQSFLKYKTTIALVTNVNYDHMENYQNSKDLYEQCFSDFLNHSSHVAIFNHIVGKMPEKMTELKNLQLIDSSNTQIINWSQNGQWLKATCVMQGETFDINMQIAGIHMLYNAFLAIECAVHVGITREESARLLAAFQGTDRRFQIHMIHNRPVVSDYGHHPEEIKATIHAARGVWPNKKLHLIFQAHRYSRLRYHFDAFIDVLSAVDQLVLVPVYGAGESEDMQYNISYLMQCLDSKAPIYLCSLQKIDDYLAKQGENDVVILQGAGNIGYILERAMHASRL